MDIVGEYRIPADKQTVWEALNDPEILRASIPGCESVERHSETELTASVKIRMGPVKATFKGKVTLADLDPPNSYTISGEGEGGVAGFGKGSARVSLADVEGETLLTYSATADVGGKLAQIGSRLVESATRKLAKDFFSNFSQAVGGGGPSAEDLDEALVTPAPTPAPKPQPAAAAPPAVEPSREAAKPEPAKLAGLSTANWTAGLVAVVLVILLILANF